MSTYFQRDEVIAAAREVADSALAATDYNSDDVECRILLAIDRAFTKFADYIEQHRARRQQLPVESARRSGRRWSERDGRCPMSEHTAEIDVRPQPLPEGKTMTTPMSTKHFVNGEEVETTTQRIRVVWELDVEYDESDPGYSVQVAQTATPLGDSRVIAARLVDARVVEQ